MDKDIILIRHAESLWNVGKSDSLDSGLSDLGKEQAAGLNALLVKYGSELRNHQLYTSPYLRCLETLQPISSAFSSRFIVDMAIAELTDHYGEQEVLVPHRTEHPKVFWSNYAYYPHTIFKKEPQTAFLKRVHAFYNRLPIRSIIITHGSIVQTIAKLAVGEVVDAVPVWDHSIPNASVTRIKDGKVIWNATKDFDKL